MKKVFITILLLALCTTFAAEMQWNRTAGANYGRVAPSDVAFQFPAGFSAEAIVYLHSLAVTNDISMGGTNLTTHFNNRSLTGHGHVIGDTTGLQAALDGKSGTAHTHGNSTLTDIDWNKISNRPSGLDDGDDLGAEGSGEANTAESLGNGWKLTYDKSGVALRFNSFTNSSGLTITSNANVYTFGIDTAVVATDAEVASTYAPLASPTFTGTVTVPDNSFPLGTKTTGNYAAGDAEAGAALTGDSATSFFSTGTLEDARLPSSMANKTFTGTFTAPDDSIALGTKTTGNYAAGDAEAGAATSGDSATSFFSAGTLEDARLPSSMANKTFTGTLTVPNDTIALGTKTTGNYAAGDAEAGAALTGDSATGFFGAGTIEPARLGSGTADNTVFLRGDGAWASPPGGGGSQTPWTGDIDGDQNNLTNVNRIEATEIVSGAGSGLPGLWSFPNGLTITNAANGATVTNEIPWLFKSNVTMQADLMLGTTNVAGAIAGKAASSHTHAIADVTSLQAGLDAKAPLASPVLTGNPEAPTQSADNNSTRLATTAYVLGQFLNTAPSVAWDGVTAKAPNADRLHDWILAGDTDYDGKANVLDYAAAGIANVNSSGVLQTPISTGAGLVAAVSDLDTRTRTATGLTYDMSATGNVGKFKSYLFLKGFDNMTGATIGNVTDTNLSTFMKPVFSNSADEAANYIEWQIQVPDDIDTSVEPRAKITYKLTAADTGGQVYVLSHASVAASAAYGGTPGTAITFSANTDASGASGDVEQTAYTTLTGWGAAVTAGRHWVIRLARDGNAAGDTSTVDSMFSQLTIEYGVSQ